MKIKYKDELDKQYGPLKVVKYTELREPSNGCVKWECQCMHCGATTYRNGNLLRFSKRVKCTNCGTMRRVDLNE